MKKFLSLVLALVMTMSLVTISAGAEDFTDDSKITYEEAVDVMSAIGVVGGYADGSFNPQGGLTRGAAAKIICNMILGPTTASALSANAAPYKDVPADNTFAGYIAYCANEGIISGYADGTFRPAAPLTGYAFMKMLLGALGYDATNEGYTGPNWSIQVAKRALNIGLDDDLEGEFVGSKALNREEACLYAFNALTATMVEYENDSKITVGDIVISNNSKAEEVSGNGYDSYTGEKSDNKTLEFCEKYFPKLRVKEDATDSYGRPAYTWYANKTKDKIGTYADEAVLVYTAAVKGTTLADDLDDAGIEIAGDVELYRNDKKPYATVTENEVKDILKSKSNIEGTGKGIVVEIFASDDELDRVVVISTYLAEVTNITKDKASTKSVDERSLTLKYEDANGKSVTGVKANEDTSGFDAVYDEVEEGDMILVVPQGDNQASEEALSVAIPETVEGVITYSSNSSIKLDGESYDLAKVLATKPAAADKEVTVYLDAYGYVIGSTANSEGDDKAVAVLKVYKTLNDDGELVDVAKVVYSDGTQGVIELAKTSGVVRDGIYTYTEDDDVYTLSVTKAADKDSTFKGGETYRVASASIKEDARRMVVADGVSKYFASNVQFIFVNGGKATVKEGVQKVDNKVAVVTINDDGKIATVFVVGKASNVVSSSDSLLFIAKKQGTVIVKDADDDYVSCRAYDAYIDGEKVDDFYSENDGNYVGKFFTIEIDEDTGAYILKGNEYIDSDEDLKALAVEFNAKTIVEDTLLPMGDYDIDLETAKYADNDTDIEDLSDLKTAIDELTGNNVVKATVLYDDEAGEAVYVYITEVDVAGTAK